jgi:hypothetical protein
MNTIKNILSFVFILIFAALVLGLPVMFLWNLVMPEVFVLTEITFMQAIELNLLSAFLIKGTNFNPFSKGNSEKSDTKPFVKKK